MPGAEAFFHSGGSTGGPALPRVHRQSRRRMRPWARPPRGGRADRVAAPAARARHHLAGDARHPLGGLVRGGRPRLRGTARARGPRSSSWACRWAPPSRSGWPSCAGTGWPGWCSSTRRSPPTPRSSPGWRPCSGASCRQSKGIGATSEGRRPRTRLRPDTGPGRRLPWGSCGSSPASGWATCSAAGAGLPQHRRPRGGPGQRWRILRAALPAGQLTVRELGNSYHVATLDNDADADLRGQPGVRPRPQPRRAGVRGWTEAMAGEDRRRGGHLARPGRPVQHPGGRRRRRRPGRSGRNCPAPDQRHLERTGQPTPGSTDTVTRSSARRRTRIRPRPTAIRHTRAAQRPGRAGRGRPGRRPTLRREWDPVPA